MADSAFLQRFLMPWTVITGNQVGVSNQGYVVNVAGTTTISLPASSPVGSILAVGTIQGDFQVTQAAGQQILLSGGVATTAGAGGTIDSNAVGDNLTIVCVVTDLTWMEIATGGILTVV